MLSKTSCKGPRDFSLRLSRRIGRIPEIDRGEIQTQSPRQSLYSKRNDY